MEQSSKKFKVVTLGCRTNQYESQAYHNQLKNMGYSEAQEGDEADLCIVNTCTVTASADSHSRHQIRQLVRKNPGAEVLVTGCMADSAGKELQNIEGVSSVVPNSKKETLLTDHYPDAEVPEFSIKTFPDHTRAFVKVQDGCNSFCTYCVIPYVRGRSRSRSIAEVLKEIEGLVENGYKEVVLTGINIGDFDGGKTKEENPDNLADLIRAVDKIPGIERIRVSSIDPDEVDDNLLDAIINCEKTCPSMHLVLQSGSNVVLKRMNRKYTRQIFYETVERLTRACPDFTVTTDVIVGFPGETDMDFADTLEVLKQVKFAKVHMFPYSERPRTRAATYPNKVSPGLTKARKQEVLHLSEQMTFELGERFIGRTMTILTEKTDAAHPNFIAGHTDNFLMVWIPDEGFKTNELIEVEITENSPHGLIGKALKQPQLQAS
ncbi:MAG: threonylcarbamoyladenosine tRNA methylthiotransferase MtaB [Chlamydiales bacterium]|jgi:threonylcarbamoyladenosine tRNA methylthiotransferase MtaB